MKIQSRQDVATGKIFVNLVLTKEELEKLMAGAVITGNDPQLFIQIVGYGEEDEQDKD